MCQPPKKTKLVSGRCETKKPMLLFIRIGENGLFVWAYCSDTVASLQVIIASRIGIPVVEQELYFRDKKLSSGDTLEEYSIVDKTETELKLVDMRYLIDIKQNPDHEKAWEVLQNFVLLVDFIINNERNENVNFSVKEALSAYLINMPRDDNEKARKYVKIFISSSSLSTFILLCRSEVEHHESCALDLIIILLRWIEDLPSYLQFLSGPILLQLCLNFSQSSHESEFHWNNVCRSFLGKVIGCMKLSKTPNTATDISLKDLNIILGDVVNKMSSDLIDDRISNKRSKPFWPLGADVKVFRKILLLVKSLTSEDLALFEEKEIEKLEQVFLTLTKIMGICLSKLPEMPESINHAGCHDQIVILHELEGVSQLFHSIENELWTMLRRWKLSFCYLLIKYGRRSDSYDWVLEHKEVTTSECRRHLVLLLFPELNDNVELSHWKIDRLQLLEQSFTYVIETTKDTLQAGLSVEFVDEIATGPGVVREWFCLVSEALFDPQKELFVACPHDLKRFLPNSASTSNPQYFEFAGRLVALSLMHKIPIGVRLDRLLILQLAEKCVSLEDIRDADPTSYRSYKLMLEMDPEAVDRDELFLRFYVEEYDRSGLKRIVELVPDGEKIVVNSKNMRIYVDLLIQHYYVKSIEVHVSRFAKGFNDIIDCSRKRRLFFKSLELEDLDGMLRGNEKPISVDEWKTHTEYNGYLDTDSQIVWFWKIVGDMSAEQKRNLLFFWTSVIYLPVEGFRRLPSRLSIYKTDTTLGHFPSSSTCFYRLYLPPYTSFEAMQDRLHIISQKQNSFRFGKW